MSDHLKALHDAANVLNDVIKRANEAGFAVFLHCQEIPHGRPYVRVSVELASLQAREALSAAVATLPPDTSVDVLGEALAEYERAMREEVIPAIQQDMKDNARRIAEISRAPLFAARTPAPGASADTQHDQKPLPSDAVERMALIEWHKFQAEQYNQGSLAAEDAGLTASAEIQLVGARMHEATVAALSASRADPEPNTPHESKSLPPLPSDAVERMAEAHHVAERDFSGHRNPPWEAMSQRYRDNCLEAMRAALEAGGRHD